MTDTKPKTLAKKIENLWYHDKYIILAILAALIMVGFALAQSLSKRRRIFRSTTSRRSG